MELPWKRKPKLPLITDDALDFKALSPELAGILKAIIGKLDRENLGQVEREQIAALYEKLPGQEYTLLSKGMFDGYGAPVEKIKALPPDKRRK